MHGGLIARGYKREVVKQDVLPKRNEEGRSGEGKSQSIQESEWSKDDNRGWTRAKGEGHKGMVVQKNRRN